MGRRTVIVTALLFPYHTKNTITHDISTMKTRIMIALSVLAAMISCSKPGQSDSITIDGNINEITLPSTAAEESITFTASVSWSSSITYEGTQKDWISVDTGSEDAGKNTVTISVTENKEKEQRTAVIEFTAGNATASVKVIQKGASEPTDPDPDPEPHARYYVDEMMFGASNRTSFEKDSEGRTVAVYDGDKQTMGFRYTDNEVYLTMFSGSETSTAGFSISDGKVVKSLEADENGYYDEWIYDNEGRLTKSIIRGALIEPDPAENAPRASANSYITTTTTTEYTWENGNITRIRIDEEDMDRVIILTVEYGNDLDLIGNFDILMTATESQDWAKTTMLAGQASDRLPVKIIETHEGTDYHDEAKLTYEFDDKGRITDMYINGNPVITDIKYSEM